MKKHFVTGLIILLPVAVTILVVRFFFNLLTEPFVGAVSHFLSYYQFGERYPSLTILLSQILILILLAAFTVGLGILTRWFFVYSLISWSERLLHRIPLISPVYRICKDVINTIFSTQSASFKQVVLVPFPNKETRTLGLVTREVVGSLKGDHSEELVGVFVPTTPNPTSGFLVMFEPRDLIYLDMAVEDAFKFIISCGVIGAPFNPLTKA